MFHVKNEIAKNNKYLSDALSTNSIFSPEIIPLNIGKIM